MKNLQLKVSNFALKGYNLQGFFKSSINNYAQLESKSVRTLTLSDNHVFKSNLYACLLDLALASYTSEGIIILRR
jgi:hypothetical protein